MGKFKDKHQEIIENGISDGFINNDGYPLKCICGCAQAESRNEMTEEGRLLEYELYCLSCKQELASWAYGRYNPVLYWFTGEANV